MNNGQTRPLSTRPMTADSIIATYHRASPADIAAGRDWYPSAGRIVRAIARESSIAPERVASAVAALSPRNPWYWNVADAHAFALSAASDGPMPASATTFSANARRAWAMLRDDGSDWTAEAPKVRAFVRAIMGDADSVVVDVWAMRVATAGARDAVRPGEYAAVADAYRAASAIVGESPRDTQAITWLVGQREGMGSARIGRHDKSLKRGTAPVIAELLTGQLNLWSAT